MSVVTSDPQQRIKLLEFAQSLADSLSKFRTPGNGDPVDPSRLAEVEGFLKNGGLLSELQFFLKSMPSSHMSSMSHSAKPQLHEVSVQVQKIQRPFLESFRELTTQEKRTCFLYVIGWARRLLSTRERNAMSVSSSDRDQSGGQGQRRGGGASRSQGGNPVHATQKNHSPHRNPKKR